VKRRVSQAIVAFMTMTALACNLTEGLATEGRETVLIPAGEFQMGCDDSNSNESCYSDEQPLHTVYLGAYTIDKYEVTNAQYAEFLNAMGNLEEGGKTWLDTDAPNVHIHEGGGVWQTDAGYEDHPVIEVTWYGAAAYCEWIGGRLPTEAEWEYAARGSSDTRMYPWGNEEPDCSRLNYRDDTARCVGDTTPVGSYPSGASPYGALDMAGNVWEWVNDWYQSDYYDVSPYSNPSGPNSGASKVFRGGGWLYDWSLVRVAYRSCPSPGYPYFSNLYLGFRCAGVAPGE
jgi:formylglycine-generating enzyme required for sulfatase activity